MKWAKSGDENTKCFHGILKKTRTSLAVKGIMKDGDWVEEPGVVKEKFWSHFKARFSPFERPRP